MGQGPRRRGACHVDDDRWQPLASESARRSPGLADAAWLSSRSRDAARTAQGVPKTSFPAIAPQRANQAKQAKSQQSAPQPPSAAAGQLSFKIAVPATAAQRRRLFLTLRAEAARSQRAP